jgi:hypothetical protein
VDTKTCLNMSGRSSRSNARGGRGRNDRQGRGGGRGHSYTGASMAHMSGLCDTLGGNVFDYGHKEAADQGRISWETLVQYVGATYGQDISNELQNKIAVILRTCAHSIRHSKKHRLRANGTRRSSKLATGTKAQQLVLQVAVAAGTDLDAPMKLNRTWRYPSS